MLTGYQIKDQSTPHYLAFQVVCCLSLFQKNRQGHHRQRITQQYTQGSNTIAKLWAGACEYITENGQQKTLTYLSGPEGVFALHVQFPNGTENIRYIHKDHLGSWNTITDENGNLLQELSFDAWGNRRNPATWRAFTGTPPEPLFDRGFTGHEHLYGFQLINMNGRIYDPLVSRMLSPDNFIQAPDFSQSFNRYSYVWNNPLVYTDPSGELIWAIPYFSIDSKGNFGIGATLGIGIPGVLSAQATVGHDFGSKNTHISVGGTASGFTASGGWGTRTGWTASVGVGLGFPIPGVGSNLTSMGWSWSQNGGMSLGAFGFTMDSHGIGFNPAIGYSHSFMYGKTHDYGRPMLAGTGDPPSWIIDLPEYVVIGSRSEITSNPSNHTYWSITGVIALTRTSAVGLSRIPHPYTQIAGWSLLTIGLAYEMIYTEDGRLDNSKLVYSYEQPSQNPIHQEWNSNNPNNVSDAIWWSTGLGLGARIMYEHYQNTRSPNPYHPPPADNTHYIKPYIPPIK